MRGGPLKSDGGQEVLLGVVMLYGNFDNTQMGLGGGNSRKEAGCALVLQHGH